MASGVVDKLVLQVTGAVDSAARGMPALLMGVGKAATAAAAAIAGVTLAAARYADTAAKTADRLGIDVEEYSALAVAADLADVSISGLISSSQSYARQLEAAASGSERQAEAFRRLGIDAKEALASDQSFADVLPTLIDRLGEIESPALRAATAQQVLGRGARELAPMIRAGSESLIEARRVTEEWGLSMRRPSTDQAERLNDALSLLRYRAQGMGIAFGMRLVPAVLNAVEAFSGLLDSMQPQIMHVVERSAAGLATVLNALVSPAGAAAAAIAGLGVAMSVSSAGGISALLAKVPMIGPTLSGATSALGAFTKASWAALAPYAPLILAIGAVVLVIDDMLAFMRGGESFIGDFAAALGVESELYMALQSAADLFQALYNVAWSFVSAIPSAIATAASEIAGYFDSMGLSLDPIIDSFRWLIDSLPSLSGLLTSFSRRAQVLAGAANVTAERIDAGSMDAADGSLDALVSGAQERMTQIEASRVAGVAARERAEQAQAANQTNNVQIEVSGSSSPVETARETKRLFDQQVRAAAGQVGS